MSFELTVATKVLLVMLMRSLMYFEGRNLGYVNASEFHSLTALTGLHTLDVSGMFPFCMMRRCCVYMLLLGAKPFSDGDRREWLRFSMVSNVCC